MFNRMEYVYIQVVIFIIVYTFYTLYTMFITTIPNGNYIIFLL